MICIPPNPLEAAIFNETGFSHMTAAMRQATIANMMSVILRVLQRSHRIFRHRAEYFPKHWKPAPEQQSRETPCRHDLTGQHTRQ
jgi:hypothetical protein